MKKRGIIMNGLNLRFYKTGLFLFFICCAFFVFSCGRYNPTLSGLVEEGYESQFGYFEYDITVPDRVIENQSSFTLTDQLDGEDILQLPEGWLSGIIIVYVVVFPGETQMVFSFVTELLGSPALNKSL